MMNNRIHKKPDVQICEVSKQKSANQRSELADSELQI